MCSISLSFVHKSLLMSINLFFEYLQKFFFKFKLFTLSLIKTFFRIDVVKSRNSTPHRIFSQNVWNFTQMSLFFVINVVIRALMFTYSFPSLPIHPSMLTYLFAPVHIIMRYARICRFELNLWRWLNKKKEVINICRSDVSQ